MVGRRLSTVLVSVVLLLMAATARAAPPTQEDVFRSISNSVDHGQSISGKAMGGIAAAVVGVVLLAVVVNHRQNRRTPGGYSTAGGHGPAVSRPAGSVHHPGKLVRELMRETGLTKGQLRQLEAANDRLADDDRAVEHLATLLLCPSLLAASGGERR